MFGPNFKKQRHKAPIAARSLNRAARQVEQSARLQVGGNLVQARLGGAAQVRAVDPSAPFFIRITEVGDGNAAGAYSWRAIEPDPEAPGAWVDRLVNGEQGDDPFSGTYTDDPFYEFNANAKLPVDFRIEAVRGPVTGELRGQFDRCDAPGPPLPTGCCAATGGLPDSITATFIHEEPEHYFYQWFPMGTMVRGAVPEAGVGLSPNWWYSGNLGYGGTNQPEGQRVLTLQCTNNRLVLGYIYKMLAGYGDEQQYVWSSGSGGYAGPLYSIGDYIFPLGTFNQCSPFRMSRIDWAIGLVRDIIYDTSSDPLYGKVTKFPEIILE